MRNLKLIVAVLLVTFQVYGDDAGSAGFGGGSDVSGLSDSSGFGGNDLGASGLNSGGNNSSASPAGNTGNIIVPPISNVDNGNGANSAKLNLNNQWEQVNSTSLNGLSPDQYRNYNNNSGVGGQFQGLQSYSNIAMPQQGMYGRGFGAVTAYVPSVFGDGIVLNPVVQQDPFQKNVQIRSGLFLPMIGYNLFTAPSTFAPINNIPVDANYTLGPGDQVNLQAWGSMNVNYTATVDKDGTIFIPKVGKISVVGIKASSLDSYFKTRIGRIYRNFSLSATVSQIRSIQVNVAGYAARPGTYQLSALSSVSNAVFAIGGPAPFGSLRHVQIKRDGRVVADFDMYDIILRGDNSKDIRLLPGDTIYFPPKGNQVAIYDGVKVAAIYEAREGETVKDIVNFAGGFTYNSQQSSLIVEKIDKDKAISVNNYPMKNGMNQKVANGDVIHFFSANNVYESSIVLMGNVANPSRYSFKPGMRIKDVIPNREVLLTRSFWNSYAYNTAGRDNLLTQVGKEKTTAQINSNVNSMYSTGLNGANNLGDGSRPKVFGVSDNLFTAGPIQIPEANINWNYATIIRLNPKTLSTNVIPFSLRKALAGDLANNIELQAGDVIDILSSKDVRTPTANSTIYIFIDGEVNDPGVYEMKPGETILDVIKRAGGITDKAYLYGTELNRESVKKKQQAVLNQMLDQLQQTLLAQASNASVSTTSQYQSLTQTQILTQQQAFIAKMRQIQPTGRVVLGVQSAEVDLAHMPAIQVENGDTIYIPTRPSTVDVIGQVYNPATFMYKPHKTVVNYIDMAGTENNFADTSSEYILRADGTIYSRQQAGWFGGFGNQTLNPGDAVIVPQQIQFGGLVQNIMNWTQIIANSAQAVALFNR